MTEVTKINENRALLHEKLIKQNQTALCNLIATLDETQYKLLTKYIKTSDKLRRHEFMNMAMLFKQNKKS